MPTLEQLEMFNVTALVDIPWSEQLHFKLACGSFPKQGDPNIGP